MHSLTTPSGSRFFHDGDFSGIQIAHGSAGEPVEHMFSILDVEHLLLTRMSNLISQAADDQEPLPVRALAIYQALCMEDE